ncbi:MAG: hypothetical protein AAF667_09835 [Pseudomonadota bacterium]
MCVASEAGSRPVAVERQETLVQTWRAVFTDRQLPGAEQIACLGTAGFSERVMRLGRRKGRWKIGAAGSMHAFMNGGVYSGDFVDAVRPFMGEDALLFSTIFNEIWKRPEPILSWGRGGLAGSQGMLVTRLFVPVKAREGEEAAVIGLWDWQKSERIQGLRAVLAGPDHYVTAAQLGIRTDHEVVLDFIRTLLQVWSTEPKTDDETEAGWHFDPVEEIVLRFVRMNSARSSTLAYELITLLSSFLADKAALAPTPDERQDAKDLLVQQASLIRTLIGSLRDFNIEGMSDIDPRQKPI